MTFHRLNADRITETIDLLAHRIEERFPGASLAKVCRDLLEVSQQASRRAAFMARPNWLIRGATVGIVVLILAGSAASLAVFKLPNEEVDLIEFTQLLEAGINDLVLIGAAIFFLVTLENRIKRGRAIAAIHELRALVHVIDMHQLTKIPERMMAQWQDTASSPRQAMTPFQLSRYLDYCSEMLSLVGKIAALYVEDFDDGVTLEAANDVENLTTGLSRKIWQKIMILHGMGFGPREGPSEPGT